MALLNYSELGGLSSLEDNISNIVSAFTNPSIGGLYSPEPEGAISAVFSAVIDILALGIPIYAEEYQEDMSNKIGEQVLVSGTGPSAGQLIKITDNIVPNPREFHIKGYIGFSKIFMDYSNNIENGYLAVAINFIRKFGLATLLAVMKVYLRNISNARRPFKFYTRDGELVPCVIKNLSFIDTVENSNFLHINATFQEFRYLSLDTVDNILAVNNSYSDLIKIAVSLTRTTAKTIFI